jgi:hypothetical protein
MGVDRVEHSLPKLPETRNRQFPVTWRVQALDATPGEDRPCPVPCSCPTKIAEPGKHGVGPRS